MSTKYNCNKDKTRVATKLRNLLRNREAINKILIFVIFLTFATGFGLLKYMISVLDEERMAKMQFSSAASIAAQAIEANLLASSIAPKMIASSMLLNPTCDTDYFNRFGASDHFDQIYEFFYGIFWAPRITKGSRAVFESRLQRRAASMSWWSSVTNVSSWTISELAPDGINRVPAADRDEYYPNQFRAPDWTRSTSKIWGWDMLSEGVRAYCVRQSQLTGQMTVSSRKYITQIPSRPYGLGLCIHLYWSTEPPEDYLPNESSSTENQPIMTLTKTLWSAGVVSGTLYIDALLSHTLRPLNLDRCTIFLFDLLASPEQSYLGHHTGPDGQPYAVNDVDTAGQSSPRGALLYSADFYLGDRPLRVIVASTDSYLTSSHTYTPILFFVLSVLGSLSGYALWICKAPILRLLAHLRSRSRNRRPGSESESEAERAPRPRRRGCLAFLSSSSSRRKVGVRVGAWLNPSLSARRRYPHQPMATKRPHKWLFSRRVSVRTNSASAPGTPGEGTHSSVKTGRPRQGQGHGDAQGQKEGIDGPGLVQSLRKYRPYLYEDFPHRKASTQSDPAAANAFATPGRNGSLVKSEALWYGPIGTTTAEDEDSCGVCRLKPGSDIFSPNLALAHAFGENTTNSARRTTSTYRGEGEPAGSLLVGTAHAPKILKASPIGSSMPLAQSPASPRASPAPLDLEPDSDSDPDRHPASLSGGLDPLRKGCGGESGPGSSPLRGAFLAEARSSPTQHLPRERGDMHRDRADSSHSHPGSSLHGGGAMGPAPLLSPQDLLPGDSRLSWTTLDLLSDQLSAAQRATPAPTQDAGPDPHRNLSQSPIR